MPIDLGSRKIKCPILPVFDPDTVLSQSPDTADMRPLTRHMDKPTSGAILKYLLFSAAPIDLLFFKLKFYTLHRLKYA
jgi:hypothetical protein